MGGPCKALLVDDCCPRSHRQDVHPLIFKTVHVMDRSCINLNGAVTGLHLIRDSKKNHLKDYCCEEERNLVQESIIDEGGGVMFYVMYIQIVSTSNWQITNRTTRSVSGTICVIKEQDTLGPAENMES